VSTTFDTAASLEARPMGEILALALFCLLVAVVSLGVVAWSAISGPFFSLDSLLLTSICLLLAAVFGFCFLWLARDARLLEWLKSRRDQTSQPDDTPKPK